MPGVSIARKPDLMFLTCERRREFSKILRPESDQESIVHVGEPRNASHLESTLRRE